MIISIFLIFIFICLYIFDRYKTRHPRESFAICLKQKKHLIKRNIIVNGSSFYQSSNLRSISIAFQISLTFVHVHLVVVVVGGRFLFFCFIIKIIIIFDTSNIKYNRIKVYLVNQLVFDVIILFLKGFKLRFHSRKKKRKKIMGLTWKKGNNEKLEEIVKIQITLNSRFRRKAASDASRLLLNGSKRKSGRPCRELPYLSQRLHRRQMAISSCSRRRRMRFSCTPWSTTLCQTFIQSVKQQTTSKCLLII